MEAKDSPLIPATDGPDDEGFYTTHFEGPSFNGMFGPVRSRVEGRIARVRIDTGPERANMLGAVHGGFLLAFVDQSFFVGLATLGRMTFPHWSITLSVATQFVDAGRAGLPLDCLVEVVNETGKLFFLRGQLEQEGRAVLTYQATLRKIQAKV